jgi:hypothetical protein
MYSSPAGNILQNKGPNMDNEFSNNTHIILQLVAITYGNKQAIEARVSVLEIECPQSKSEP